MSENPWVINIYLWVIRFVSTIWDSSWDYSTYRIGAQHPRSLARAFAVHTHKVWKNTEGPTKNETSSPTGWLRIYVWRMSSRRMKSTIILWDGSFLVSIFILAKISALQKYRMEITWLKLLTPMSGVNWATSWENLFMPCANNKGASTQSDQHLCCSLLR